MIITGFAEHLFFSRQKITQQQSTETQWQSHKMKGCYSEAFYIEQKCLYLRPDHTMQVSRLHKKANAWWMHKYVLE